MVKNQCRLDVRDMVQSLGWEDLEEGMATHSSILAWRDPKDRGTWAAVHGVAKSDMTEAT